MDSLNINATLDVTDVVCAFGQTRVVDQVNLQIQPGEHVALIGSNGSGKTTLLRAILGLHTISAGQILIDGIQAKTSGDWHDQRRKISWMPQRQTTGQFPLLVKELLTSSASSDEAFASAEHLGVSMVLDRPLHALSGGQLQRVFLARALGGLAGGASLLLADEPTAALDFDGQIKVAEVLQELSSAALIVTHDRKMADRCHRVVEMAGGRLREVS